MQANGSAPIGVFDSGVGGLSIYQALRAQLPTESFIYIADSGHAPYGERSTAFITARAFAVAGFLTARQAKAMVIACNTASVVAASRLRQTYSMPIVAMEPAIKPATQMTQSKVILVLATTSTLRSAAVARLCHAHGAGVQILLRACPGLANQVERGDLNSVKTRMMLQRFILPGIAAGADTVVLGCTHYAFLLQQIAAIAGPSITLIEPSAAIARQLSRVLPQAQVPPNLAEVSTQFFTTGSAERLASFLATIGEPSRQVNILPST